MQWVQGSSDESHSRSASFGALTPIAPCFVAVASTKLYLIVLPLLPVSVPKIFPKLAPAERTTVKGLPCDTISDIFKL